MSKYYNYIYNGGCQAGYYQYGVAQRTLGNSFYSKIVGVTFDGRQRFIPGLSTGEELQLRRERWNQYDSNAIAVYDGRGNQLGYISKELASNMAPMMDGGAQYRITVTSVTGGNGYSYGVNVSVLRIN